MSKSKKVEASKVEAVKVQIDAALKALDTGVDALVSSAGQFESSNAAATLPMVKAWKPLLTFTKDGRVDESTKIFGEMRKAFRTRAYKAQNGSDYYKVEYRLGNFGGIRAWTERSVLMSELPDGDDAKAKAEKAAGIAAIDKLDLFVWLPSMRDSDKSNVSAALMKQVYDVQIDRLQRNERQLFNTFKAALNSKASDSGNTKSKTWEERKRKELTSHGKARIEAGEAKGTAAEIKAAINTLMKLYGYK